MGEETFYFVHLNKQFNDGGLARSSAFYSYYKNKGAITRNVFHKNKFKRALVTISALNVFFFSKNKTIFIHQGTILYLFLKPLFKYRCFFTALFRLLQRTSNRNRLIVEVNDLPYEQAIDLELAIDVLDKQFEEALYTLKNCFYIFASHQMNEYVTEKFKIKDGHSEVVINGATKLNISNIDLLDSYEWTNSPQYRFGYAGTLNKGRQIESLIELFKKNGNIDLILLGEWGDWLLDYDLPSNVLYLGNKENLIAQQIMSKCDFGLIQYDANRFYYNLCFPTKISFYLTAGIPVLTTPLTELLYHFEDSESVYFVEFDKWEAFLLLLNSEFIDKAKRNAQAEGIVYEWDFILSSSKFLNT
jgi:glycosyltransferase involved in cell wall biosynthesis